MPLRFEIYPGTGAIDRQVWNDLAAEASPVMEWEYYNALESSGSISAERGYKPSHIIAYDGDVPVALAPMYERDRAWVEFGDGGLVEFLTELTGIPFHRGLVGTIPYTPVPGYSFLYRSEAARSRYRESLLNYIDMFCETRGLTTSRIYFLAPDHGHMRSILLERGYLNLKGHYSLWFNRDYRSFDDYLATFRSSRRTKIKRELRSIEREGIEIKMVNGTDAPLDYYLDIHRLYVRTWIKHMGYGIQPFLNEEFFLLLARQFRKRTSFCVASRSGERIALALFYHKNGAMYGRYWGCFQEVQFLHFATCYYYPIQYAISTGIGMMDPGFGGEHKLIRGFEEVKIDHYIKVYGAHERSVALAILSQLRQEQDSAGGQTGEL